MIIPSVYGCFVDGMDKIYATNTHDAQPKPLTSKNDIGLPIRRFYVYPSISSAQMTIVITCNAMEGFATPPNGWGQLLSYFVA